MVSKAEVFLSSDSKEFRDCRRILAKILSAKPLLNCVPLEYRGPKSSSTLEASLEAVRKSDIVVIMIGEKDSELTRKEIEESIRELKYCLVYVKKSKKRDPIMENFIKTTIEPEFTHETFTTKTELYSKIKEHLDEHILNILTIGLEAYKKKRKETKGTLKEVHDKAKKLIVNKKSHTLESFLNDAEDTLSEDDILTSIVKATTAMEFVMLNVLKSHGFDESEMKKPMGWIVGRLQNLRLLDLFTAKSVLQVWSVRNQAVHEGGQKITKEQAIATIQSIKVIISKLKQEKNIVRILRVGSQAGRIEGHFEPESLFVNIGEKVKWLNLDTVGHTVTSGTPEQTQTGTLFNSSIITPNREFEFVFNKKGMYRYFDALYPWVEGKIIVG